MTVLQRLYMTNYYKDNPQETSFIAQRKLQEEKTKKRMPQDCIDMCLPYAPLLIIVGENRNIKTGELRFLYDDSEKCYRLLSCSINFGICWKHEGDSTASFVLDMFGDKNGIKDLYSTSDRKVYYWKDKEGKFLLTVVDRNTVSVYPICSETMLHPLHHGLPPTTNAARMGNGVSRIRRQFRFLIKF